MSIVDIAGYTASLLVFATFCMKRMIPLRVAAIGSNVAFLVYGFIGHIYPVLVLHMVLLPLNVWRTVEMLRLVRRVKAAAKGDLSFEWLKPFMRSARHGAGDILFRKGDEADRLYFVLDGEVLMEESRNVLGPGTMFGEIGLFSPTRKRTQTGRCLGETELLWLPESDLAQLCYQTPAIAFHLLRLTTRHLLADVARLEGDAPAALGTQADPRPG